MLAARDPPGKHLVRSRPRLAPVVHSTIPHLPASNLLSANFVRRKPGWTGSRSSRPRVDSRGLVWRRGWMETCWWVSSTFSSVSSQPRMIASFHHDIDRASSSSATRGGSYTKTNPCKYPVSTTDLWRTRATSTKKMRELAELRLENIPA